MMTAEDDVTGFFSQHDVQYKTPLWRAFEEFRSTLHPEEISAFTGATLEEVLFKVRDLDRQHTISNKSRTISRGFEPLIQFLDRHGRAIDCMVQTYPNPSALVWGILRVILEVRIEADDWLEN